MNPIHHHTHDESDGEFVTMEECKRMHETHLAKVSRRIYTVAFALITAAGAGIAFGLVESRSAFLKTIEAQDKIEAVGSEIKVLKQADEVYRAGIADSLKGMRSELREGMQRLTENDREMRTMILEILRDHNNRSAAYKKVPSPPNANDNSPGN